jgi:hypothetical protein
MRTRNASLRRSAGGSPGSDRLAAGAMDGTACQESDSGRTPPRLRHNARRGISCASCGLGICVEKRGLPHQNQRLLWSAMTSFMPIVVSAVI